MSAYVRAQIVNRLEISANKDHRPRGREREGMVNDKGVEKIGLEQCIPKLRFAYHRWHAKVFRGICGRKEITNNVSVFLYVVI
jgi:hypothetical protein